MAARIFFAWIASPGTVAFSTATHAREDVHVLDLRISQSEGSHAIARVETENPGLGLLAAGRQQWALMSASETGEPSDAELLFRGRVMGLPSDMSGPTIELEFVSEREDLEEALDAFALSYQVRPYWDPLYLPNGNEGDPAAILDARGALFDHDRKTLDISISDYLEGTSTIDIGSVHDRDQMSVSPGEPPVRRVKMLVSAEWEQKASGETDIIGDVGGRYETCTGQDFLAQIPPEGGAVGENSGWTVSRRRIEHLGTRAGNHWYEVLNTAGQGALRVDEYAIREFEVRYDYRQSRREEAYLELSIAAQDVLGTEREETLDDVSLGNLIEDRATPLWEPDTAYSLGDKVRFGGRCYECQKAHTSADRWERDRYYDGYVRGRLGFNANTVVYGKLLYWKQVPGASALGWTRHPTFFARSRGRQAIEHALLRMRAYLRNRLRCLDVQCVGKWEDLVNVSCRHSVRIADPRLPGGECTGKVSSYELIWNGSGERWVALTLGVSVGTGAAAASPAAGDPTWIEDGYVEAGYAARTGDEAGLEDIAYAIDPGELVLPVDAYKLGGNVYAVRSFDVENPRIVQESRAWAANSSSANVLAAVDACPTRFKLELRDLAGWDTLVREYDVSAQPCVGPRGINLEAAT